MLNPLGFAMLAILVQPALAQRPLPVLRQLYAQQCARCHGLDGSARSPEGLRLKGLDFTSPQDMKGLTDRDLEQAIASGVFFGLKMPAFRAVLSEEETRTMVRELLRKAQKGRAIGPSPDPGPER